MARIVGSDGKPIKRARRDSPGSDLEGSRPDTVALDAVVAWLKDEIDTFERMMEKPHKRGRKIQKKYKDVRSPREDAQTRYNILWANVQTRLPALFARTPKAVVDRRYKDRDPVGRTAAEVLERCIDYTMEVVNDFYYTMRLCMLDYELPGLAAVWVRYEPHFKKRALKGSQEAEGSGEPPISEAGTPSNIERAQGDQITDDVESEEDDEPEELEYEETIVDYVNWDDLGWSWSRTWQEARLLWRRVYMDRRALTDRFTDLSEEQIQQIPLDWSPKNLNDSQVKLTRKKAVVYEVWDKQKKMRYWVVKNFPKLLDEREDALGLNKFFPTPRPLMANMLPDEMIRTPNFTFYQDQANEIDELSTRIVAISKALKVAGVRDTSAPGLDRLLSEGVENQLVPVDGWAALKEKGGLKGVMELLPLEEIAQALGFLRDQRKSLIEDVYQLTGIADIVRGFSAPTETATAQQMKGQFSMLRIQDAQQEVQRFCRDVVHIVGEIVAGYSLETIKAISGVKLLTNAEKAQLQAQLAQQQAQAAQQAALQKMQQAAQQRPPGAQGQPPGGPPGAPPGAPGAAAPPGQGQGMPPEFRQQLLQAIQAAAANMHRPRRVRRNAAGLIEAIE